MTWMPRYLRAQIQSPVRKWNVRLQITQFSRTTKSMEKSVQDILKQNYDEKFPHIVKFIVGNNITHPF